MPHIDEQQLRRTLLHIVDQEDILYFLQPHLTHVNNASLNGLYRCLQSRKNGIYFAIDNVVMDCYSNDRLYTLMHQLIAHFTK